MRIQDDSVRLRLNRAEVAAFAQTGRVESVIHFPGHPLSYVLESESELAAIQVDYTPGTIRIRVPSRHAAEWAASDQIALHGAQAVPGGPDLAILIEKDLKDPTRK